MRRLILIVSVALLLVGCESSNVKKGRGEYEYFLSCMYYEYKIDKEYIKENADGSVKFTLFTRVREKDGQPYKSKVLDCVYKDGKIKFE